MSIQAPEVKLTLPESMPEELRRQMDSVVVLRQTDPYWEDAPYIGTLHDRAAFYHSDINSSDSADDGVLRGHRVHTVKDEGYTNPNYINYDPLRAVWTEVGDQPYTHSATRDEVADGTAWVNIADGLLESMGQVHDPIERHAKLVGAVLSSQFMISGTQREAFLRSVYTRGLASEAAQACADSPLALVVDDKYLPGGKERQDTDILIHRVRDYARVFQIDPNRLEDYLLYMDQSSQTTTTQESPKRLLKEMTSELDKGGITTEMSYGAQRASIGGEGVGGRLLDIYKLERFALEMKFLEDQAETFFDPKARVSFARGLQMAGDLRGSVATISRKFAATYPDDPWETKDVVDSVTDMLGEDIRDVFRHLSEPVVERYRLDGVDLSQPGLMTREQRISMRYHEVLEYINQSLALAQYLDFAEYEMRGRTEGIALSAGSEVWSASIQGAATHRICKTYLEELINAAIDADELGAAIEERELFELAENNRRLISAVATHNIPEVKTAKGAPVLENAHIARDEYGVLQLNTEIAVLPRDSQDLYAAIALGCPALRVRPGHEESQELRSEERIARGAFHYLGLVVSNVITEARRRGMFNLKNYQDPRTG